MNNMRLLCFTTFLPFGIGCASIQPGEAARMWRPLGDGLDPEPLSPGVHVFAPWNSVVR